MRKLIIDLEAICKFVVSDGKLDKNEVVSLLSFIQRHIKEEGYKDETIDKLESELRSIDVECIDDKTANEIFYALNDLILAMRKKYWKTSIFRFLAYLGRWQLSTPIYSVIFCMLSENLGYTWKTIIANFVGGCVFYWIDKFIFAHNGKKK